MSKKYVFMFEEGNEAALRSMGAIAPDEIPKELLGGKGANLCEMIHLGLPVPPGFTVSTEACTQYYNDAKKINADIEAQIFGCLAALESKMGKTLGDPADPLLVSVRSGARASMPGMMDTILNLGLNDRSVLGLAKKTGNTRFAYDSYRRFIQMFSDVVMEQEKSVYERILDDIKHKKNAKSDTDLTADDLKEIVNLFKAKY
ncbi:MAG: pyruvate, phosphate dikinase, partial [Firmicutes bacterium]|nr:pyruvate, phosphate dikinase [Bacillota bacterium]